VGSSDFFLTLGEIAVTLAGFSSVVVVFNRRESGKWEPADIARLRGMLGSSLGAALFSVLPVGIHRAGVAEATAWSVSSFVMSCWMMFVVFVVFRRNRLLLAESYSLRLNRAMIASMAIAALLLQMNAFSLGLTVGPAAYIFAVVLVLVQAGVLFMRLVMLPLAE